MLHNGDGRNKFIGTTRKYLSKKRQFILEIYQLLIL